VLPFLLALWAKGGFATHRQKEATFSFCYCKGEATGKANVLSLIIKIKPMNSKCEQQM
jgi:hypothetical protein